MSRAVAVLLFISTSASVTLMSVAYVFDWWLLMRCTATAPFGCGFAQSCSASPPPAVGEISRQTSFGSDPRALFTKKMSESDSNAINGGRLQDFTIDQAAGAIALSLGALGSPLLVIWQSCCLCRCRIGISDQRYRFDCSRELPAVEDDNSDNEEQLVPPKSAKTKDKSEVNWMQSRRQ